MKFLFYNLLTASDCGVKMHPQDYMKNHFNVIHCVPQSLMDGWWFCVEDFDFKLPSFLSEIEPYNLKYWKDDCYRNCEYFKKSYDCVTQKRDDRYCCYGGDNCLKEKYDSIEDFEKTINIDDLEKIKIGEIVEIKFINKEGKEKFKFDEIKEVKFIIKEKK